jgi:hypothetical protein
MPTFFKRLVALLAAAGFITTACFSSHQISLRELEKLQTGFEAEQTYVATDGCADTQRLSNEPPVDGRDPVTGCRVVAVGPTNTLHVHTRDDTEYRITPFNFTLGETQLVSPDYDLLLSREALDYAEVETFSTGRTIAVIAGLTAAAVGTFLVISLTAGESRGLGGTQ